ncbi:MAG TPA: hypothetical protein PKC24_11890 [Cyclobacteriaceae bacterium]|nr:hypothetical protein [Cyclobacteriaceae bacterium]
MMTTFSHMANDSRVWVYQSYKKFTDTDKAELDQLVPEFIQSWTAHNRELKASYQIWLSHFIILAVDESAAQASGCSIDKSVHFIKFLEQKLNTSLTDRSKVALIDRDDVKFIDFIEFKNQLKYGVLNAESKIINSLVSTKDELLNKGVVAIGDSPYARFLAKANQQ